MIHVVVQALRDTPWVLRNESDISLPLQQACLREADDPVASVPTAPPAAAQGGSP